MNLTRRVVIPDALPVCPASRLKLEPDTDRADAHRHPRGNPGHLDTFPCPRSANPLLLAPQTQPAGAKVSPRTSYLAERTAADADWARGGTTVSVVAPTRS